jgi:hypothetical protein
MKEEIHKQQSSLPLNFSAFSQQLFVLVNGGKRYFSTVFSFFAPSLAFPNLLPVKSFYPINYNPKPLAMEIGGETFSLLASSRLFYLEHTKTRAIKENR